MSRHRSEVYAYSSLTLSGTAYPICLAFALINALAKQQASKPSTGKVSFKKSALINALAKRQAGKAEEK